MLQKLTAEQGQRCSFQPRAVSRDDSQLHAQVLGRVYPKK
jgi:hypothetical protein